MNRERSILLLVFVAICLGLSGWLAYKAINTKKTTFMAGAPPKALSEIFVPANIPLARLRPPALRATDPMRFGGASSSASLILFGTYRCQACKELDKTINASLPKYRGVIRYVWRNLPDPNNNKEMEDAVFAYCAGLQNKFWVTHDAMMAAPELDELAYSQISDLAKLDRDKMNRCRFDISVSSLIRRDSEISASDGVTSTPLLFVGTEAVNRALPEKEIDEKIRLFMSL